MNLYSRILTGGISILLACVVLFPHGVNAQCAPAFVFTGEAEFNYFGDAVSGAGDVNSDGFADIIVGAHSVNLAYVYSGQTGELLYVFDGVGQFGRFGRSVSGAGDVDNDGYADLIVGADVQGVFGNLSGRAYVYSGQTGLVLYVLNGENNNDVFGISVSGAGDVNADGYADLIVGAPANASAAMNAGRAYVYSGKTGELMYTFTGEAKYDGLGFTVSGAGDVNSDGFDDLIVGAPNQDAGGSDAGGAYVYSGQTGDLLYKFIGKVAVDKFGYSVSGANDVDNDGYDDLLIGSRFSDIGGRSSGRADVYSGQTGEILYTFVGETPGDQFGWSVSGVGDVDKDLYADVLVGANFSDAAGANAGRAYLYSGQTGELLQMFTGEAKSDAFGISVSGAGDIDSDGFADIIVGARQNSAGGGAAGRAYVYSSSDINGTSCNCCNTPGDADSDGVFNAADVTFGLARIFGYQAAAICSDAADVNGDGAFNISDVTYGIARIFSGGPAPVCGTNGF